MKVTREMIGAAHDILLKKEMVLSADLLADIYMAMASRNSETESLRQQLADSQKREVMLRDALRFYKSALTADDVAGVALAATADFSKYVLCHAEPKP
jgi:hypothetical protein